MPKQTFDITVEASALLREYQDQQRRTGTARQTLNQIVSEAIKLYCLTERKERAEEIFEKTMEHRFIKYENRLAAMIAAVGVDVSMILSETLENIAAYDENRNRAPDQIYDELRKEGVALFKQHKAFRINP